MFLKLDTSPLQIGTIINTDRITKIVRHPGWDCPYELIFGYKDSVYLTVDEFLRLSKVLNCQSLAELTESC